MEDSNPRSNRRPDFNLEKMKIHPGSKLFFKLKPEAIVEVIDIDCRTGRKFFSYDGKIWSLNSLLKEFDLSTNWLISYPDIIFNSETFYDLYERSESKVAARIKSRPASNKHLR